MPQPNPHDSRPTDSVSSQDRFLQLFLASEREIYRYISAIAPARADAEEILQQTAVDLWKKFDQFDHSRPFTPLACRFALNVAKQWLIRKRRWQGVIAADLADRIADRREQSLPKINARIRHLDACIEKLPVEQRQLIRGYYFCHHSIETVAAEARRTVAATYKALQRIRQALANCIEHADRLETGS